MINISQSSFNKKQQRPAFKSTIIFNSYLAKGMGKAAKDLRTNNTDNIAYAYSFVQAYKNLLNDGKERIIELTKTSGFKRKSSAEPVPHSINIDGESSGLQSFYNACVDDGSQCMYGLINLAKIENLIPVLPAKIQNRILENSRVIRVAEKVLSSENCNDAKILFDRANYNIRYAYEDLAKETINDLNKIMRDARKTKLKQNGPK